MRTTTAGLLVLSCLATACGSSDSKRRAVPRTFQSVRRIGWHSMTSWLSYDGGGSGGSAFALIRSISGTEITAYVEHEVEATGSSNTASYVIGTVTFERCF